MQLQAIYEKQDDIPAEFRPLYSEKNGKFELTGVQGVKTQQDFDRFETALRARLADATAKLEGAGSGAPSKAELREMFTDVVKTFTGAGDKGKQGGAGESPELHELNRRLSAIESENATLKKERDRFLQESQRVTLETQLTRAALQAGVEPTVVDMVIKLTAGDFELNKAGTAVVKLNPSVKGVTPDAAPAEYFRHIATDDVFRRFWPESKGGGANGNRGGGGNMLGAENPFSKAGWNLTKQGLMMRDNPAEAERMMQAAGVTASSTKPNR